MESPEREQELRAALRDAAQEYEPDRTRISNRVAAGRSAPPPKGWVLRPMAAAAAVAVITVLSVVAVRASNDQVEPPPLAGPVNATAAPSKSRAGSTTGQHPDRPATTPTDPAPTGTTPAGPTPTGTAPTTASPPAQPGADFLTGKGAVDKNSVATWSQQNVTITTTEPVESLTVTIKVAMTAQPAEAGRYTTVPNSDVAVTVERGSDWLTYTYDLRKGVKLIPGSYVFAAQFTHHSGRPMSKDYYTITAHGGDGDADLSGKFQG